MSKRDTYKYELMQGNKVVYVGITNDPARREMEHRQDKNFDKMRIVGSASTLDSASQWDTKLRITMRNNKYKNTCFYLLYLSVYKFIYQDLTTKYRRMDNCRRV